MEEAQATETSPQFAPAPKRRINKRFIYLALTIVAAVALFLGFKVLTGGTNQTGDLNQEEKSIITKIPTPTLENSPTPTEKPTPTPTNTPTPRPTVNPVDKETGLDRSKLSVTVQNGSGQAGVAAKASDFLKNLGYNVVATDNADNFDYQDAVISVKSGQSEYLALLEKDLGTSYTIGSISAELSSSFSSDALVIIGK